MTAGVTQLSRGLDETFDWYKNHSEKVNKKPYLEYSNEEKKKLTKNINTLFIIGIIAITIYIILEYAGISETLVSDKIKALMLGISYGIMTVGVLYTSGSLIKIKKRIPSIIYKIKEGRIKDESS